MEGLIGLSELVEQAQALLGDADSSGGASTFLRVVALGSVVREHAPRQPPVNCQDGRGDARSATNQMACRMQDIVWHAPD